MLTGAYSLNRGGLWMFYEGWLSSSAAILRSSPDPRLAGIGEKLSTERSFYYHHDLGRSLSHPLGERVGKRRPTSRDGKAANPKEIL
jgi:hypothetical protein